MQTVAAGNLLLESIPLFQDEDEVVPQCSTIPQATVRALLE